MLNVIIKWLDSCSDRTLNWILCQYVHKNFDFQEFRIWNSQELDYPAWNTWLSTNVSRRIIYNRRPQFCPRIKQIPLQKIIYWIQSSDPSGTAKTWVLLTTMLQSIMQCLNIVISLWNWMLLYTKLQSSWIRAIVRHKAAQMMHKEQLHCQQISYMKEQTAEHLPRKWNTPTRMLMYKHEYWCTQKRTGTLLSAHRRGFVWRSRDQAGPGTLDRTKGAKTQDSVGAQREGSTYFRGLPEQKERGFWSVTV